MKRPENQGTTNYFFSLTRNSIKLSAIWLTTSLLTNIFRITHAAYGIQGDLPIHYHIARSFVRSFEEGNFLPRWAGLLDGGRGDAIFTFYPPLSYLLSAIIVKFLALDVLTSLRLLSILIIFFAQVTSYLLAREFFERKESLIVSIFYVMMPAFPLIALHRAFLANAVGMSLAPLAILGAYRLLSGRRAGAGLIFFILGLSGVILAHAITTYMTGIVLALLSAIIVLSNENRADSIRGVARLAGAGLIVAALTAFYLWPQKQEIGWVQVNLQLVQQDYRNYLLFAGARDSGGYRARWASVNYVTSLITVVQTCAAVLFGLICGRTILSKGPRRLVILFGLSLALIGLYISLPASGLIWRYVPGFKFIQFPWRFQPFVSLGCGMLAAAAFGVWKEKRSRSSNLISAVLTWVIIGNLILTGMLIYLNEPAITREQAANLLNSGDKPVITVDQGKQMQNEDDLKFTPYAANQVYFRPPGSDFNFYPPAANPGGLSILSGRGRIISQKLEIDHREFRIENEEPTRVRIETYRYPHWSMKLDGREIETLSEKGTGLMLADLPSGRHLLTLSYEIKNRGEKIARLVSAISWPAFGISAIGLWFRNRKRPESIEDADAGPSKETLA